MILANVVHPILKQLDSTTCFQVSNIFIACEGESRTFLKSCKDTGTLTDTHGLAVYLVTYTIPWKVKEFVEFQMKCDDDIWLGRAV